MGSTLKGGLLVAALVAFPFLVTNPYYLHLTVLIFIFSILLLGLDVVFGYTGEVSLGHAALLGIGAYTAGVLNFQLGIGMVATNDGHYVKKSDATAHETLLAIQTKAVMADENRFKFPCDEFYVKNLDEMHRALPPAEWGEELFDNTGAIADLCNVELPVGRKRVYQMPALPIPEGRTMAEELRMQTYAGAMTFTGMTRSRIVDKPPAAWTPWNGAAASSCWTG